MSGGERLLSYEQSRKREIQAQITNHTVYRRGLRLDPDPAANVPSVTSGPFPDHEFSIHGVLLSKSTSTNATLPTL
jgi:hypothetical protein